MSKRKAYRPKPVDPRAGLRVFSMRSNLDADQVRDIAIAFRVALNQIMSGSGQVEHLHTLAFSSNIALMLCEVGYGAEFINDIKAAQEAVLRGLERFKRSGSIGLDGPGFQAIKVAFEIHEQQLELTHAGVVLKAISEVKRRLEAGDVLEVSH